MAWVMNRVISGQTQLATRHNFYECNFFPPTLWIKLEIAPDKQKKKEVEQQCQLFRWEGGQRRQTTEERRDKFHAAVLLLSRQEGLGVGDSGGKSV